MIDYGNASDSEHAARMDDVAQSGASSPIFYSQIGCCGALHELFGAWLFVPFAPPLCVSCRFLVGVRHLKVCMCISSSDTRRGTTDTIVDGLRQVQQNYYSRNYILTPHVKPLRINKIPGNITWWLSVQAPSSPTNPLTH